jgi:hypothetical protein
LLARSAGSSSAQVANADPPALSANSHAEGHGAALTCITCLESVTIDETGGQMGNRLWSNAAGGDWFQASNWDTTVPGANDDVFINLPGSYTVTLNAATASINSLTIDDATAILSLSTTGALNITGSGGTDRLSLTNGDVVMTGGVAITAATIVAS